MSTSNYNVWIQLVDCDGFKWRHVFRGCLWSVAKAKHLCYEHSQATPVVAALSELIPNMSCIRVHAATRMQIDTNMMINIIYIYTTIIYIYIVIYILLYIYCYIYILIINTGVE